MRILLLHPNYHSGGAEIAGNWPPAWVAYIAGTLKAAGYRDVSFIDAMTDHLSEEETRARLGADKFDVIAATAITPAIYKAERILQIAKEEQPRAVTVLGGIHGSFMYKQVLTEAPWIDVVARGEGENVFLNLVRAIDDGTFKSAPETVRGVAYADGGNIVATPAEPPIQNLDELCPDWGMLSWDKYNYIPMGVRLGVPNFARGCPFTCSFCSQWKFWRTYRVRSPANFVDEIETLVGDYKVGFFILADEEPTIHRKKFVALCEELVRRGSPARSVSTV